MKLDILVELLDSPGQLSHTLATVSRFGGNISSVLHERAKRKGDYVPVRLVLEAAPEAVDPLVNALREECRVLSVSGATASIPHAFLLLGHVFESSIQELTDEAFAAGSDVRRFTAEIASKSEPSAALVEIASPSQEVLAATRERLKAAASRKGLVYVEALGGGSE